MSTAAPNTIFYVPAHDVQRPTVTRLHIRDARDAQVLFEAVRTGILKPVVRRLNDPERGAFIRSGNVFVWQESDDELGLKRWTDGHIWSASRMRDPFLFYELRSKTTSRSSRDSDGGDDTSSLVKQTYSALVTDPQSGVKRKWHLTAYFTHADFHLLPTIQDEPRLRGIVLPQGIYKSGKSRQSLRSMEMELSPDQGVASGSRTDYSSTHSSPSGSPGSSAGQISPSGSSPPPSLAHPQARAQAHPYPPSGYHPQSRYPFPSSSPPQAHSTRPAPPPHLSHPSHHVPSVYPLPSIHTTIADQTYPHHISPQDSNRATRAIRSQEDERLIRLLDSRGGFA